MISLVARILGKRWLCSLATVAVCWLVGPTTAGAAEAYFPGGGNPPATQITRDFSLKDAAKRGLVKLTSKGNGFEGDLVSVELTNKRVSGPITIAVHAEFTTKPGFPLESQQNLRDGLPEYQHRTEAVLNRGHYKTRSGDPIRFKVDYQFRAPSDPPRENYHQLLVINPNVDLDEPDPKYRARIEDLGAPNALGEASKGTFTSLTFSEPKTLAHETLHLVGLGDRYGDFYKVGGHKYPLPERGMSRSELAEFARNHHPPLRPPPAGEIVADNFPGTGPCDIMADSYRDCSRISKRDLKFLEGQAGVQVIAEPGDLLLGKTSTDQNFGVGFRTKVFADPGETTVANGVSVFCIDYELHIPATGNGFDAIGPASQVPGYEDLGKLLELSGRVQPSIAGLLGMQGAVWNVTDGQPVGVVGYEAEARALLGQAGVAEDSHPQGLPYIPDPNASSPDTGAVTQTEAIKTLPSKRTKPRPDATVQFAALYPSPLRAAKRVRADLLLSTLGSADGVRLTVKRRAGRHWRRVRRLPFRKIEPGTRVLPLRLGRLTPGRYRLAIAVAVQKRTQATRRVAFRVR